MSEAPWWLRRRFPGIPPEILINHSSLIQEIIKSNKLTPVSQVEAVSTRIMSPQALPARAARQAAPALALNDAVDWWWKYGGMKAAHLHYGEDVYILNESQWQSFASGVMKDISARLQRAKSISFEQFLDVTDGVRTIG
jgi:hypothetical protein